MRKVEAANILKRAVKGKGKFRSRISSGFGADGNSLMDLSDDD
jgi:hypothetical protein